ncbi:MAG: MBL fold metallo-hydrolase [Spirochaetes bacterium]|nr:MBL fold metallo-hydrolase [Spirochaetota bacterium]
MQIRLWGVRGSLASPISNEEYSEKLRYILKQAAGRPLDGDDRIDAFLETLPHMYRHVYGGNTTCVTVTSDSGTVYIIDAGSGIRPLGDELMKGPCGKGQGTVRILFTHFHWDHIQGLPFFKPLYIRGNEFHFYSTYKDQEDYLVGQMKTPYFPATFEGTPSTKNFHYIDPRERKTLMLEEGLAVDFYPLKHPGGSFAFRFKQNGKIFILATDAEFTGEVIDSQDSSRGFFDNADLLILDSQYTLDESFMKIDWGHTSYTMAVNCGIRWNIKTLVLTHHEPSYNDAKLFENYNGAIEHRNNSRTELPEILMATEGMVFDL